jgi:hypothetical protein
MAPFAASYKPPVADDNRAPAVFVDGIARRISVWPLTEAEFRTIENNTAPYMR